MRPCTLHRPQRGGGRWLILVAMLMIVGLFWYLNFGRTPGSFGEFVEGVTSTVEKATTGEPATPPEPAPRDRILSCTAPDGSTFYTNAARCEDADLDNRVTEFPAQQPMVNPNVGRNCLDPKVPHQFRPVCAEAFRSALELESDLAASANPLDAPELDEYCDLIGQGVHAGCPANSAVFCFLPLCQERARRPRDP